MALIKTTSQQARLRVAGQKLRLVYLAIEPLINTGTTPQTIDQAAAKAIAAQGAVPSFLHYHGYPNASCVSVNEQVVHAIPNQEPLQEGDIVTVDIGLKYDSVYVDAARTYGVGIISPEAKQLIAVTEAALAAGIAQARPGQHVGAISQAIQQIADRARLGIVRAYTGHGVGTAVHEDPSIPNYGQPTDGILLKKGMVLAIEPMFTLGGGEVLTLSDGWTVITNDNTLAAQVEHTILLTDQGNEILV